MQRKPTDKKTSHSTDLIDQQRKKVEADLNKSSTQSPGSKAAKTMDAKNKGEQFGRTTEKGEARFGLGGKSSSSTLKTKNKSLPTIAEEEEVTTTSTLGGGKK